MATLNKYHKNNAIDITAALRRRWVALRLSTLRLAGIGKTSQAVHSLIGFLAILFSAVQTAGKKGMGLLQEVGAQAAEWVDPLADLLGKVLGEARLTVLRLRSRHVQRDRMVPAMMLVTATVMICTISFMGVGLRVTINGQPMGYIGSKGEMETILMNVEDKVSNYLGSPYSLNLDVAYTIGYNDGLSSVSEESVSNFVMSGLKGITTKYVLTVDGEVIGAHESKTALELLRQRMLEASTADYRGGKVEFVQDVKIVPMGSEDATMMSIEEMETALSGNSREPVVYTVQSGDTVSGIAYKYDTSVSAIEAANPDLVAEKIKIGDEITVSASIPTLSVKETVVEEYTRAVGYETVKETTDALYTTQSRVKRAGVNGEAAVTAEVVYVNGQEQERTVLEWINISEPVDEIIEVGTKKPPKKAPTGSFMRPANGYISSRYGYRRSMGDFHTGVDFAGPTGTPIYASDGGKVTYAGWKGNYGYCVFVDHGNGYTTVYAHCSKLLVKVGQSVGKGETIAKVGSTGRSTGPHLHFEIRVNGKHQNPLNYIR